MLVFNFPRRPLFEEIRLPVFFPFSSVVMEGNEQILGNEFILEVFAPCVSPYTLARIFMVEVECDRKRFVSHFAR